MSILTILLIFNNVNPSNLNIRHKFELMTEQSLFQQLRTAPPSYKEIIKKAEDRMPDAGIITRFESSWTSSGVVVAKEDGSLRFCVEYPELNAIKRERVSMPRVDQIFDAINVSKILTTIDLYQGYWQIKTDKAYKRKNMVIYLYATLNFEVVPFELKNLAQRSKE